MKAKAVARIAAIACAMACAARADEFGAMPGLWRTTYTPDGAGAAPSTRWHCVDELADPWVAYAQLPAVRPVCPSAQYQRSLSALKWKVACGAAPSEGELVFDSPRHYSGSISTGAAAGGPPRSTLHVDGERRAACTSPSD